MNLKRIFIGDDNKKLAEGFIDLSTVADTRIRAHKIRLVKERVHTIKAPARQYSEINNRHRSMIQIDVES